MKCIQIEIKISDRFYIQNFIPEEINTKTVNEIWERFINNRTSENDYIKINII